MKKIISRTEIGIFLIIFISVLFYMDKGGGDMAYRHLDMTFSMADDYVLHIDKYHTNTADKAYYKGHYYALVSPGLSLISLPPYFLFKSVHSMIPSSLKEPIEENLNRKISEHYVNTGRFSPEDDFLKINLSYFMLASFFILLFTGPALAGIYAIIMYRMMRLYSKSSRVVILSLVSVLGTLFFFYSTVHHPHAPSALATLVAFYLLYNARKEVTRRDIAFAGIAAGSIMLMNLALPTLFICMAAYALYVLKPGKAFVLFSIFAFLAILPIFMYNLIAFDSPLNFPHKYADPTTNTYHQQGFLGLSGPRAEAFFGLLFTPKRGLFLYMPIIILSVLGLYHMIKDKKHLPEAIFIITAVITTILFYSSYHAWEGAWSFGPRYLTPLLPLLFIPIAYLADWINSKFLWALSALSIFINWLGPQRGIISDTYANPLIEHYIPRLFAEGPTSHILGYISIIFNITSPLAISILAHLALLGIIILIWRKINENSNLPS
jgi:hypothetical protein